MTEMDARPLGDGKRGRPGFKPVRPVVVASRCLEFAACRYNGLSISSPAVRRLKDFVEFMPVCPEVEIGLGVPREPIRVIESGGGRRLVQPATGRDCTREMESFSDGFLSGLGAVDGFILKSRSPSCGFKDVKVYPGTEPKLSPTTGKGTGFFGGAVLGRFPGLAAEDEGRLENLEIREHFLSRLWALADLRLVGATGRMEELVGLHSRRKLQLMAASQKHLRELGRIVANPGRKSWAEAFGEYASGFRAAFSRRPRFTANVNVLMHALGYFKDGLSAPEKAFFLEQLESYRRGRLTLSAVLGIMRSWIVRFGQQYLAGQAYFEPYPSELSDLTDSAKGRRS
jgi:uncharacterized protein YbgA (DUF1722 family)/uncharacterized protein YbbK (DUF523 family)